MLKGYTNILLVKLDESGMAVPLSNSRYLRSPGYTDELSKYFRDDFTDTKENSYLIAIIGRESARN